MLTYFIYNGAFFREHEPVIGPRNRGLRYGAGFFETIKFKEGRSVLFDRHFDRLEVALQYLGFSAHPVNRKSFTDLISALCEKNGLNNARVRVNFFLPDGIISDVIPSVDYLVEAEPFVRNRPPASLCIFETLKKPRSPIANFKSNNGLIYLSAALFAAQQRCDDAIVLNDAGDICESGVANIFIVKDRRIFTPSLAEGCIAGVMRGWLIEKLSELGMPVRETRVTVADLTAADETFLTNSIVSIRPVATLSGRRLAGTFTDDLSKRLLSLFPEIIS